jgi:hypothetical protein
MELGTRLCLALVWLGLLDCFPVRFRESRLRFLVGASLFRYWPLLGFRMLWIVARKASA